MAFGQAGHSPALRSQMAVRRQNLGEASVRGSRTEIREPRHAARAPLPRRRGSSTRIESAVRPRDAARQSSAKHSALAVGDRPAEGTDYASGAQTAWVQAGATKAPRRQEREPARTGPARGGLTLALGRSSDSLRSAGPSRHLLDYARSRSPNPRASRERRPAGANLASATVLTPPGFRVCASGVARLGLRELTPPGRPAWSRRSVRRNRSGSGG